MFVSTAIIAIAAIAVNVTGDADRSSAGDEYTASSTAPASDFEPSAPMQQAPSEADARAWLDLVDAGNAAVSRDQAADALRATYGENFWELGVALRRNNFGLMLDRRLVAVKRRNSANGVSGEYEVLTFETDFSKESAVIEQLYMQEVDGRWRVAEFTGADDDDGC